MENELDVNEKALSGTWKSDEIVAYLNEHIEGFDPTNEETEFFETHLKLNKKGKVKLGGFLLFLTFAITLGILINVTSFAMTFQHYTVLGLLLYGGLLGSQLLAYISILRKLKIGKILLLIQYILFLTINIFSFTPSAIGSIIITVLMITYVLTSKRVKFTLVERLSKDAVHYE